MGSRSQMSPESSKHSAAQTQVTAGHRLDLMLLLRNLSWATCRAAPSESTQDLGVSQGWFVQIQLSTVSLLPPVT